MKKGTSENEELRLGTDLAMMVKEFFFVQKRRVAAQLRIIAKSKLILQNLAEKGDKKAGEALEKLAEMIKKRKSFDAIIGLLKPKVAAVSVWDEDTESLYYNYKRIEDELVIPSLKGEVEPRPVWSDWLKKVKGIDLLLAAEILGGFEWALKPGETLGGHFEKVSQMWSFAGLAPVNGRAVKAVRGGKLPFCKDLRSILIGRLGSSFIRQSPDTSGYRQLYDEFKKKEERKLKAKDIRIIPSSALPKNENGKRYEPEGVISKGHVHMRAVRKTVKVFVAHLFEKIRQEQGFEAGKPYVIDVLGHSTYIAPIIDN